MKTTARILVASCLPLLLAACSGKATEASADQAEAKPAAAASVKADKADKVAEAAVPSHHEGEAGCIYAEGEKDEGQHECPHGPAGAGADKADGEGHFGSPFTLADAKPLSNAIEGGTKEEPVLVQGEVEAVCQKKGCWMVIKDGEKTARVLMKDHGFSVPMDSRGKKATIEGTLATRTFTEAQVKHLAKDGGDNPDKVDGERTEHVLTASGVRIQS